MGNSHNQAPEVALRPGTAADSYAVFSVFEHTLADLSQRLGSTEPTSAADPDQLELMWEERRSLYEHLARTAEQYWLAEREGQIIGFARSILRDGTRELTELFVLPGQQSSGLGRRLLARAFPANGARHRSIIATADSRAQALYLGSGVYPRFPICYFGREPEVVQVDTDLRSEPITASLENLATIGVLDKNLLGHRRDQDHQWLLADRQGHLYYRGDQPVGYGYVGPKSGPFALLDPTDMPAVLAQAESYAAAKGHPFGLHVPMVNQVAVDYLLERGFRLGSFMMTFMSDSPPGKFDRYLLTNPPFFA